MNPLFSKLHELRNRFLRFMVGRYGIDQFSKELAGIAFVLYLANLFLRNIFLQYIFIGIILYVYYRMFSKNLAVRAAENQKYLVKTKRIRQYALDKKEEWPIRKTHRIYRCPTCQQKIRVPRGRGRIQIHCPKCHTDFIKKT